MAFFQVGVVGLHISCDLPRLSLVSKFYSNVKGTAVNSQLFSPVPGRARICKIRFHNVSISLRRNQRCLAQILSARYFLSRLFRPSDPLGYVLLRFLFSLLLPITFFSFSHFLSPCGRHFYLFKSDTSVKGTAVNSYHFLGDFSSNNVINEDFYVSRHFYRPSL